MRFSIINQYIYINIFILIFASNIIKCLYFTENHKLPQVIYIDTRNQDKTMVKLRIYRSQFAINEGKHRHVWGHRFLPSAVSRAVELDRKV